MTLWYPTWSKRRLQFLGHRATVRGFDLSLFMFEVLKGIRACDSKYCLGLMERKFGLVFLSEVQLQPESQLLDAPTTPAVPSITQIGCCCDSPDLKLVWRKPCRSCGKVSPISKKRSLASW